MISEELAHRLLLYREYFCVVFGTWGGHFMEGARPSHDSMARWSKTSSRSETAVQKCLHESVQAIYNFCTSNGSLHHGLSRYATYFLFQAVVVLDEGLLQALEGALSSRIHRRSCPSILLGWYTNDEPILGYI